MELRSFIAGMLFLLGLQILIPVIGIRIDVALPYAPYSTVFAGLVAMILAYYIFKSN